MYSGFVSIFCCLLWEREDANVFAGAEEGGVQIVVHPVRNVDGRRLHGGDAFVFAGHKPDGVVRVCQLVVGQQRTEVVQGRVWAEENGVTVCGAAGNNNNSSSSTRSRTNRQVPQEQPRFAALKRRRFHGGDPVGLRRPFDGQERRAVRHGVPRI